MDQTNVLVSTDWVQGHLGESSIKIFEVDIDTWFYDLGHIPGAIAWNWKAQLQDQIRRDIVAKKDFEALLSASGVHNSHTIVLYGDNSNWFAANAFWVLKLYGHEDVRLLDGGRKKWVMEPRPLTQAIPTPIPAQYIAKDPSPNVRARWEQVLESIESKEVLLVDTRSTSEFSGVLIKSAEATEPAQRGGHIPGAINLSAELIVKRDGAFLALDELQSLFLEHGITPDKEIITYCRIGERSSIVWFVLKYLLAYPNVRNYDGSWAEWGNMIAMPIQKGLGEGERLPFGP